MRTLPVLHKFRKFDEETALGLRMHAVMFGDCDELLLGVSAIAQTRANAFDFGQVRLLQRESVRRERLLHFVGPGFKRLQQVAVPALEVLKNIIELAGRGLRIELENTLDNMVGSRLVSRVEIARFGRRLERTDDYARGVGTQVKRLPIEKSGL